MALSNTEKVIVIQYDGTEITLKEWQKLYGLEIGSDQIGKYFSLNGDPRLLRDVLEYGKVKVAEPLILFLDLLRKELAKPLVITSFNRSHAKQLQLRKAGYKTAKYSPHEVCLAADIDCKTEAETRLFALTAKKVAEKACLKVRVGSEQYIKNGQTFIHVDVCPEYFGSGKPWAGKQHPFQWEEVNNW